MVVRMGNGKDYEVTLQEVKIEGKAILCTKCGRREVVTENSLCDLWRLCVRCARQRIQEIWAANKYHSGN